MWCPSFPDFHFNNNFPFLCNISQFNPSRSLALAPLCLLCSRPLMLALVVCHLPCSSSAICRVRRHCCRLLALAAAVCSRSLLPSARARRLPSARAPSRPLALVLAIVAAVLAVLLFDLLPIWGFRVPKVRSSCSRGHGRKILEKMNLAGAQTGKTKVFLRAGQMAELDARRAQKLSNAAKTIQRKMRTYIARKHFLALQQAAIRMQSAF